MTFRRRIAIPLAFCVLFCFASSLLPAANFTVNDLGDTPDANPGDGVAQDAGGNTTLRAAIEEAEALAGPDTIQFDPALLVGGDVSIELQMFDTGVDSGELGPTAFIVTTDITIVGPTGDVGVTITRDNGASDFRFFHVMGSGDLTLRNLTLNGGSALGGDGGQGNEAGGGGGSGLGGAIVNEGLLTIENSTLANNQALGGNGGRGGGNFNGGGGGGGVGEDGSNGTDPNGGVGGGPDGGAANSGNATGDGGGGGGGRFSGGAGSKTGGAGGNGAIFGGGGAGGMANATGGGATATGGAGGNGGFGGGGGGGGRARSGCCSETPGSGGAGGFAAGDGEVGGRENGTGGDGGGGAGLGGALFNFGGTSTIINSTISGNSAVGGSSGGGDDGFGGMLPIADAGGGDGLGGAIFNLNGTVTLTSSTVAGSNVTAGQSNVTAGMADAAVFNLGDGATATLSLTNTIVADTTGGVDIVGATVNGGTSSTAGGSGGNLVESSTSFSGTVATTSDPNLGALADNRGPTPTHALQTPSPAIDAGNNGGAGGLTTDQRLGIFSRIADGDLNGSDVIDIGAFELVMIDYGDAPDFVTGTGPASILLEQGSDDFRISTMGSVGNANIDAFAPRVAYNATDNEYLVVWQSDDDTGGLVDNEFEIYAQRINAATGALVGGRIRVSQMGAVDGSNVFRGNTPAVAWNSTNNRYLVVWSGDDDSAPLVDNENEIFGALLNNTGGTVASQFRISVMGNDAESDPAIRDDFAAFNPRVAYNATSNEFLVVWVGDNDSGGVVDNENEVFGRRINAQTGALLGSQTRISSMGTPSNANIDTQLPDVAWNSANNRYLIVWHSDNDTGGQVDNENEIYGELVDNLLNEVAAQFRISFMGATDGSTTFNGFAPAVAYNPEDNEFLTVWYGDDDTMGLLDNEFEVFGRRINAQTGALLGGQLRVSETGGTGDAGFDAVNPTVAYNSSSDAYLVAWQGDELMDNKNDVFGKRVSRTGVVIDSEAFAISNMGDGVAGFFGGNAAIAANPSGENFLTVWTGDDNTAPLVNDEQEIFGQLVGAVAIVDYETLGRENGPAHVLASGLMIGAAVDDENDGQPTLTADGDDLAGVDDEDGVILPIQYSVGMPMIDVTVTNTSGTAATLYGWIDYNGNGVFENATERASAPVPNGTVGSMVSLTFPTVPALPAETTFARFRLSTDPAAADPTGLANDGEVEDYPAESNIDTTPDAFSFTPLTDVALSTLQTSNSITVSGLDVNVPISVTGGEYSINGDPFTSAAGMVGSGDTVVVRHTSSASFSTPTDTTLDVNGVSDVFTSTTLAEDTTPDAFNFVDVTDVPLSTVQTSNAITVSGINSNAPVSIVGGEYSVNGGGFTSAAGSVINGDSVAVRHTSSAAFSTPVDTTLTIGGVPGVFTSTTLAADTVPNPFMFTDLNDVDLSTVQTSNAVVITDINTLSPISVSGGEYSINGGPFTAAAGTVSSGDSVRVRHTSSASFSTPVSTTLTVGGVSDDFVSTTLAEDVTPDLFSFTDLLDVQLSSLQTSNAITVAGINSTTPVSVVGGEYSINGDPFKSVLGEVNPGDSVQVRHTSSAAFATSVDTTLTIGGVSDIFTSTTVTEDGATPDPFAFTPQTDVPLSSQRTSNAVTVSGILVSVPISVAGGEYSINGGPFTAAAGTVVNGDTVSVRHTSSPDFSTTVTTTLTIGGVSGDFDSTTLDEDLVPDPFMFVDQVDVGFSIPISSNQITVSGINSNAPISVIGGEYSVNGGAFTSAAGTVADGDSVQVRHTTSASFGGVTNTILDIGGVTDTFTTTTIDDGDGVPAEVEDGGPNGGDANNDSIPDSQQANVVTLPTATGNGYMTLEVQPGCPEITGVAAVGTGSVPQPPPAGSNFPFGLVEFTLPCETANLDITYHNAVEFLDSNYLKFGPTTPGIPATADWYGFSAFSSVSGNTWTLSFEDNRLGDDTGDDGLIVDQGGPSVPQGDGIAEIPTLSPLGLLVMGLLLSLAPFILRHLRRRRE